MAEEDSIDQPLPAPLEEGGSAAGHDRVTRQSSSCCRTRQLPADWAV